MRRPILLSLLSLALMAALPAQAAEPSPEVMLKAVGELGFINGTALACGQQEVATQIKGLMILRAPRTRQFGEAFESATQNAFLERSRLGGDCPAAPELTRRAEALAESLPPMGSNAVQR